MKTEKTKEMFKQQDILANGGHVDVNTDPGDTPNVTGNEMGVSEIINTPENSVIGEDQIKKAMETLRKYKTGKTHLEDKIVKNEQWWKMRHMNYISELPDTEPKPASGWLFNCIISKHADFMDAFPSPVILPREMGDDQEAKMLTDIIPVILEHNDFESVYSDEINYKLKNGTGCYGVFWDQSKLNGLGDISIKSVDLLSLFWEPGITDIQDSKNIFSIQLVDNETLENTYPQTRGKLKSGSDGTLKQYVHDDSIDTTNKSLVVDWYYKKNNGSKTVLHFCKFVNDIVLYATENDTEVPTMQQMTVDANGMPMTVEVPSGESKSVTGLYDHGKYPYVFDVLFKEEQTPYGFGFVDVCKNAQMSIDSYNNAIEKSLLYNAQPRWFVRADASINEEELLDPTKAIVHTDGNLGADAIRPMEPSRLDGLYVTILNNKIDELKETSGNRDVTNGGSTGGVTAASGIAAMQEQSGKTSRDMIKTTYRAYSEVITICIELIRQFYDLPRQFRITGERGRQEFVTYSNMGLKPMYQGNNFGIDMGYRLPVFDIKVSAQKENKYSQLAQNELALQFYNSGFFNPQFTDQVLACIDMMQFQGKEDVVAKIEENGGMYRQMLQMQQMILQLSQIVDAQNGTNMADEAAGTIMNNLGMQGAANISAATTNTSEAGKENAIVEKARDQAATVATPN